MKLDALYMACERFEKLAGLPFDLDNAKAHANRLITDMSFHEASDILGAPLSVTEDELIIALKSKLIELQSSKNYGFSNLLANKQHALIKAFSVLEPIAKKNSSDTYAFEGDDTYQETVVAPMEAKVAAFEKASQQKPVPAQPAPKAPFTKSDPKVFLDPKKSNTDFWGKLLYNAIGSYSYMFSTPKVAGEIFKKIATYNASPAYGSDKELKEINAIEAGFDEASAKLQAAGINPIEALKKHGMQNVNPNIITVLKSNLQVMKEAKDFSKYQHFYLPKSGETHPKDIIDLDEQIDKGPGY